MTQRIFDVENEKDMADLWSILPIEINKLYHESDCIDEKTANIERFIKIKWHDKTEITRPIQEAKFDDVGKLCVFWDSADGLIHYGILESIGSETYRLQNKHPYSECYHHCRRLTKQEIEELI